MKEWLRAFCILMILPILSSGCQISTPERTTPSSSLQGTPFVASPPPSPLPASPSPSPLPASPSPLPSATLPVDANFDFSCWPIKPLEQGNGIKGRLLYANYSHLHQQYANGFFAWDINTFQSAPVKFAPYQFEPSYIYLSPDGKLAALISGNNLLLISQDGTQSFPLPIEKAIIRTYLPDGHILFDNLLYYQDYQEGKGLTHTFYLFNPLTGEITKHSVFLPNFVPGKKIGLCNIAPI
jgi:hypothetical protein